ncbi:UNVERIFIED_CONTAM: Kunitz-type serine protease inhibitor taicotoxin [Trichonephila clavipes]
MSRLAVFLSVFLISVIISTATGADNDFCSLPPNTGPCRAAMPRFYYDSHSNKCEKFLYGGCQGNKNNFKTIEDCQETCAK